MTATVALYCPPESSEDSSAPRRRMRRPQQHGSLSQRRRGAQASGRPPCRGHPVRVLRQRRRVRRPPVQCRCAAPVQRPPSGPPRPVSSVRCPMSGVRCMRPASVRLVSVSTLSAPASWWSAWVRRTATRIGPVGSACPPCPRPERGRRHRSRVGGGWDGLPGRRGGAGCARGSPVGRQLGSDHAAWSL